MTGEGASLVLGVDGGASSTRAALADLEGNVIAFAKAGPSNHVEGEEGRHRLRRALEGSAGAVIAALAGSGQGERLRGLRAATLGMTGIFPNTPEAQRVQEELLPLLPGEALAAGLAAHIEVAWDARTALEGATEGEPGILVYAGTGSVAMGRDDAGKLARAGGWGWLIDDQGGGYTIGRHALRAVFRAADGRGPETRLTQLLLHHFGAASLDELYRLVNTDAGPGRATVAAAARHVARAALEGDQAALAIYRQAAHALAELAIAVARPLKFESPAVYYSGGVFRVGPPLVEPFQEAIARQLPRAAVMPARSSPLAGALLMSCRQLGWELGREGIQRLREQLEKLEA